MKTAEALIDSIVEHKATLLSWPDIDFSVGKNVFRTVMKAFYKFNLWLNQLKSSEAKKAFFQEAYDKISFLGSDVVFCGYFDYYWYIETNRLLTDFAPYVDFYRYPEAQEQLSAIAFYFDWFLDKKDRVTSCEDFEESQLGLDRCTAHAGWVMGEGERPVGIPDTHWWWFDEKIRERNRMFNEQC